MFSRTKQTQMALCNNGQGPKGLPEFKLDDLIINCKEDVNFLGVILIEKPNKREHIDSV